MADVRHGAERLARHGRVVRAEDGGLGGRVLQGRRGSGCSNRGDGLGAVLTKECKHGGLCVRVQKCGGSDDVVLELRESGWVVVDALRVHRRAVAWKSGKSSQTMRSARKEKRSGKK